ncbi:MAG: glycine--tRNA ligase subunit beta [Erythrobacter sp. SCN 68-10]|nr:MAG: glycine--tRNA ligase subunit beta [Erythrobacter sp. SCN 68-10]
MADFLLELRCEEIPARMQSGARAELEKLFRRELDAAGVAVGELTVWSTPRRLALIARGLPLATEAVSEEAKGPPEGAPDAAIDGFCKKNGVTRESLELRDVKGRMTWFAVVNTPGRAMAEVLAAAIPAIIRDFAWPKSMRWGVASITTDSLRWVRPLSGIVALFDGEVVECEVGGIVAGAATEGHRFHHQGEITIGSADDYAEKLRACHVIVDHEERARVIREGARAAAAEAGLVLVEDEGLVVENAGLTEWPVPLLGRFDEAFLDVPPEVIQLTARVNQKYFVCQDADGKLANAFVCTANIAATDPAVVVDGNRKVLAARLSDARFFWEQDQKTPLAVHAEKLSRITFHEKLGTVANKVERVAELARWLVESGVVKPFDDTPQAKTKLYNDVQNAAALCKADLVTEMVGEFPELQGLMGGYYAAREGLPQEVADAVRDHYKPVGQGDEVPTAPVTVAVSLADKLDTLRSFFAIDEKPTGSKDPFALRRAALGIIRLIQHNALRLNLSSVRPELVEGLHFSSEAKDSASTGSARTGSSNDLLDFFADRLKVQQREAGVRHDLIDAVFALGGEDDLVRLLARVRALQAFVGTEDGANLLAGYKRAANILKKEGYEGPTGTPDPEVLASLKANNDGIPDTGEEDPLALVDDPDVGDILAAEARRDPGLGYAPEPAEAALIDALDAAAPRAAAAVEAEHFAEAMAALATLRAPIDSFFDEVTVNDPQADKRAARLALLARFRDAVHRVADFSRIEG